MSWNLSSYYSCVSLAGIADAPALNELLQRFATSILPDLLADEDHDLWSAFDDIREDVEDGDSESAVAALVKQIHLYLKDVSYQGGGVSFVVGAEYGSDTDCGDLVDTLCKFLLPYASTPYLLMRAAAFDRDGGYSHQNLLYNKDGQVVREHIPDLLERLFATPTATVGDLLFAPAFA